MIQWIKNLFKKKPAKGGYLPNRDGYLFGEDPHWPEPLLQDRQKPKGPPNEVFRSGGSMAKPKPMVHFSTNPPVKKTFDARHSTSSTSDMRDPVTDALILNAIISNSCTTRSEPEPYKGSGGDFGGGGASGSWSDSSSCSSSSSDSSSSSSCSSD